MERKPLEVAKLKSVEFVEEIWGLEPIKIKMRIAYIAPYQGASLLRQRPILRNLALAANVKVETISELLKSRGHDVEILSQGEVVDMHTKLFKGFSENGDGKLRAPVHYASALPIKFINGFWSSQRTLSLFKQHHRARPFDLVILYNLKQPQVACARHAIQNLRLPLILEYEDDAFVNLGGKTEGGLRNRYYLASARRVLEQASGGIGVSPHLMSRMPAGIPKLLLRGVVDKDIVSASKIPLAGRKNWVVYSGTHFRSKGLEPLIAAWKMVRPLGWELHIAGRGELTARLEKLADNEKSIVFHGLLNREQNARFLAEAKIGINPHDLSDTPGNVFAFKIIEYIAAGAHCITTPMGALEPEIEAGLTYIPDNTPETIAGSLKRVIEGRGYEQLSTKAALDTYGPEAVARSMDEFVQRIKASHRQSAN